VREVIAHLEQQTGVARRFIIVRQNLDALEIDFANMLMEDTNNDGMSYLDCLSYLVRQDMVYIDIFCRSMLCSQAYISFGTLTTAATLTSLTDCFRNSSSTVDTLQLQWVNRPQKMWHGEGITRAPRLILYYRYLERRICVSIPPVKAESLCLIQRCQYPPNCIGIFDSIYMSTEPGRREWHHDAPHFVGSLPAL
jgi:hypothetical protein